MTPEREALRALAEKALGNPPQGIHPSEVLALLTDLAAAEKALAREEELHSEMAKDIQAHAYARADAEAKLEAAERERDALRKLLDEATEGVAHVSGNPELHLQTIARAENAERMVVEADMRANGWREKAIAAEAHVATLRAALVGAGAEFEMESALVDGDGCAHQPSVTWTPAGWATHRAAVDAVRAALAATPAESLARTKAVLRAAEIWHRTRPRLEGTPAVVELDAALSAWRGKA
ncbi:MAG: hypothetical protein A2V88_02760 [Elusimicrobia bacterium RBG_16_66_12]|nr:MAG: hypothetical protein A2V88_02760 [Elusimicrobia bacterium RBG_16_66_12]